MVSSHSGMSVLGIHRRSKSRSGHARIRDKEDVVVVVVVVIVVVVVVGGGGGVGAPPYQLCWLIFRLPELWGEGGGGGRGRIIAYKPTSTSHLPPNLMPSFKFYN